MRLLATAAAALVAAGLAAGAGIAAPAGGTTATSYGAFHLDPLDPRVAYLDGPIEEHAADDFETMVKAHPDIALLVLDSPGGLTEQARVISEFVYALGIDTFVPEGAGCYSACSTIFFGGAQRVTVGELGVHRSFSDEPFESAEEIAYLLGFTLESWIHYGLPLGAILATYRTPHEDIHVFTPEEVAGINRGTLMALNRMSEDLLARIAATAGVRYVALDRNFDVEDEFRGNLVWEIAGTPDAPTLVARIAIAEEDLEVTLEMSRVGTDGATRIDLAFTRGDGLTTEYIERLSVDTVAGNIVDFIGSVVATGPGSFRIILPARWTDRNDELIFDQRGFNLVFSYHDGTGGALLIDKLSAAAPVFAQAAEAWRRPVADPALATAAVLDLPPDPPKVTAAEIVDGTATWAFDPVSRQAIVTLRFPAADVWGRAAIGRLEGFPSLKVQAANWSYPDSILHDGFVSLEGIAIKSAADGAAVPLAGDLLHRGFSLQVGDTDIAALLAAGWIELTFANDDGTLSTVSVALDQAADDVLAMLFGEFADAP
ncbi:MAG: hypothetical protein ACWA6X_07910 [Bauldia sp.]